MRTGRPKAELVLSDEERRELDSLAKRRRSASALAQRARMVLGCAAGADNKTVARRVRVAPATVGRWRRRFIDGRVAALIALLGSSSPVRAQPSVLVGLGSTFPMGTLTDSGPFTGANTGWQATIGIRGGVGSSGIALGARAFYGANGYEGPSEQDSRLVGITALGTWTLADGPVSPLFWSEAGFLSHRYSSDSGGLFFGGPVESSDEALVLSGGVGAGMPVGSVELLLLGGYAHGFGVFNDVRYLVLIAATSFAIG